MIQNPSDVQNSTVLANNAFDKLNFEEDMLQSNNLILHSTVGDRDMISFEIKVMFVDP